MGRNTPPETGRKRSETPSAPPTPEQIISGVFKIKPSDVKRIVASKPGKGKGKRGK